MGVVGEGTLAFSTDTQSPEALCYKGQSRRHAGRACISQGVGACTMQRCGCSLVQKMQEEMEGKGRDVPVGDGKETSFSPQSNRMSTMMPEAPPSTWMHSLKASWKEATETETRLQ